jgi:hypothetical protein
MAPPVEAVDVEQLRRILATDPSERSVVAYMQSAPWIPYWTFCASSGHDRYAIFEFPLGNAYKCDLLLLNSYSGSWEALFIEFEPVGDRVFTKAGVPTKRLAAAQKQVDEWSTFIERNRELVRADMVRYAKAKDRLLYSVRKGEPSNMSGQRLADPTTYIVIRYKIVIGRSSVMSPEALALAGRYRSSRNAEVVSYDRLLHLAERRYEQKHGARSSVLDWPA